MKLSMSSSIQKLFRTEVVSGPKIFCISFQRTGTTSVGQFFKEHGYVTGTWDVTVKNEWSIAKFKGDLERIFDSSDFKRCQVFEDAPWGGGDFYKLLFHRFPDARFILLERDKSKWFDSMVSHSNGLTLGNTHRHCTTYDRLPEYFALNDRRNEYTMVSDNLLPLNESYRAHYERIYATRNTEAKSFFEHFGGQRLFHGKLEDAELWQNMGRFFKIPVKSDYSIHANASKR